MKILFSYRLRLDDEIIEKEIVIDDYKQINKQKYAIQLDILKEYFDDDFNEMNIYDIDEYFDDCFEWSYFIKEL